MSTTTALTKPEKAELQQLEEVIERGLATFVEVGVALLAIREKKLYRDDYESFEAYCQTRWEMGRRRANQLIAAAGVFQNLLPLREVEGNHGSLTETSEVEIPLPETERQARPLAELEPAEQRDAWKEAVATSRNGKPTSEDVQDVVDARKGKRPLDIIRQWAAEGKIGKRAANELEALGKSAHKRFVQLVNGGISPADALKELSREPGDDKPPPPPPKPAPPKGELRDQAGNVVPDRLRDVFADDGLPKLIDELEQVEAMIRPQPWLDRAAKLCDHHGFILIDKFSEHAWQALQSLQLAREALAAGLPHAVCPKCQGAERNGTVCRVCRGHGHVPHTRYTELSAS